MWDAVYELPLFALGLVGIFWCTVYALLAYGFNRVEEMESLGDQLVREEVYYLHLRPRVMEHLDHWAKNDTLHLSPLSTDAKVVALFVDIQCAILLDNAEYEDAVTATVDYLRPNFRLYPTRPLPQKTTGADKSILRQIADDACCQYMWNANFVVDLVGHLTEIYTK